MATARLALESGEIFRGQAFGDTTVEAAGEVVFTTALTGYQETVTDPSYRGQIIAFTYPHIGNYGVHPDDDQSDLFQSEGIIVREFSKVVSNWRATGSLDGMMRDNKKIGIEGIDTRKLVRILRDQGAMRGIITASDESDEQLLARVRALPSMQGQDLTGVVTTPKRYEWNTPFPDPDHAPDVDPAEFQSRRFRVAAIDYGIKRNILMRLATYGLDITVFPASVTSKEIKDFAPDGIFLSNGPGDPAAVGYAIETIKELHGFRPIFGICLGHQLLAHSFGASTYKMKFGHRGLNHPIKNLRTSKVEITSQNHGFAVDRNTMGDDLELTHINLNDGTVAGFAHKHMPIFCVQYHPEAAPGTFDSEYLFLEFRRMMESFSA
jgi:carbamoyl-phosphate synthase small subunit